MKMKKYILPVCVMLATLYALAQKENQETPDSSETIVSETEEPEVLDVDSVAIVDSIAVIDSVAEVEEEIARKNSTSLILFSEEMKNSMDRETLDFIEEALSARLNNENNEDYDKVKLTSGSLNLLKKLTPETPCTVNTTNSKTMTVEWNLDGKKVGVEVPMGYDTAKKGSRTEIENDLISKLKRNGAKRKSFGSVDKEKLEAYGEDLFILPGKYYQNKEITRNIFFVSDSALTPVWSKDYPLESLADLFLYPSDKYGDVKVKLTVLKHEYGEQETVEVPLQRMMAVFEQDGCIPYWGVEKFSDGNLEGALFFYNQPQGYNHVLKIECNPADLMEGKGEIKARASLYIPVNNVRNLYAPYTKKTEKEKIKWKK